MLPLAVMVVFVGAALVTSALAHDEKRWRYAATTTVVTAAMLVIWGGQWLRKMAAFISLNLHPIAGALIAAVPFLLVVWHLIDRRRNTPRHIPSLDDDPVLRRYVAEKTRRLRKRRQEEEALENAEVPARTSLDRPELP